MGRAPCCDKANVKKGPWSPAEDAALKTYVHTHGTGGNWIALPRKAGLKRCGKSCRLRWLNYLRPGIKLGGFTEEEDNIICTLYGQMGSRWSAIASQIPGRTDNDVKNYWNTKLKKKQMAGKVSLKTMTDSNTLPSTLLPTQPQKNSETQISHFPASQNQSSTSSLMPILDADTSSTLNISQKSTSFDPIHQLCSPLRVMDAVSGIGANYSRNNSMVSLSDLSHESSTISNSSSIIVDNLNRCVSLPQHAGEEARDASMDFGFGFPYDIADGLYFEMDGEFSPSCYPELVD